MYSNEAKLAVINVNDERDHSHGIGKITPWSRPVTHFISFSFAPAFSSSLNAPIVHRIRSIGWKYQPPSGVGIYRITLMMSWSHPSHSFPHTHPLLSSSTTTLQPKCPTQLNAIFVHCVTLKIRNFEWPAIHVWPHCFIVEMMLCINSTYVINEIRSIEKDTRTCSYSRNQH